MDALRPIKFTDALVRLQALIGTDVNVIVNFYGKFFGCAFAGKLDRVETFPPDHTAIKVVLDDGQGFFLDPADTKAFVGRKDGDDASVLELKLGFGATVTLERSGCSMCTESSTGLD
ncbi:MAG TPA: hypothetical protein VFM94_02615 [Solirubrobacterales bacterium]|nr:hypothetical protein [Solirubrobacterales bacterium]